MTGGGYSHTGAPQEGTRGKAEEKRMPGQGTRMSAAAGTLPLSFAPGTLRATVGSLPPKEVADPWVMASGSTGGCDPWPGGLLAPSQGKYTPLWAARS